MPRYKDDEKVKEALYIYFGITSKRAAWGVDILVDRIPDADVAPVRHAHWYKDERFIKEHYFCSLCNGSALKNSHAEYNVLSPFCPRCGAKMDEETEK